MEREKGQNVASMSCPNCGGDTPLVAMPDGGMAQATCSKCFGTPEVASVKTRPHIAPREKATEVVDVPTAEVD